ncbi:hypothetical protein AOZ07_01605 [Glutamicibacter halophytocola]|nr:DUF932 domain-containing protein [Glutamicibacter halophytocola]ALG27822.1 hypothetical protein AOZ07_01605 [Glutamicibacter halophytocola]
MPTIPFTGHREPLSIVCKACDTIQNEEHTELLNQLLDQSGTHFETADSIRGGREVFVTMKLPEHTLVGDVDRVDLYIAAMSSRDGSAPFRFVVTPIRVVCANTKRAAMNNAVGTFSIRHTRSAKSNIAAARQALSLAFKFQDPFQLAAEQMIQQTMAEDHFRKYFENPFPAPSKDATTRVHDTYREKRNTPTSSSLKPAPTTLSGAPAGLDTRQSPNTSTTTHRPSATSGQTTKTPPVPSPASARTPSTSKHQAFALANA